MRYPYERFLRFLITRKADVNRTLTALGLPSVGPMFVSQCRATLRDSAPVVVRHYLDSTDKDIVVTEGFLDWADQEGTRPLWEIQAEFGAKKLSPELKSAYLAFGNPASRAIAGMCVLAELSDEETAGVIREKFDYRMSPAAVALYKTVFWDITVLGRKGWDTFITQLLTKDERHYVALGLDASGLEEVRAAMNIAPDLEPDEVLSSIMNDAFMKYKAATTSPNPDSAGAKQWGELAIKAAQQVNAVKKGLPPDGGGSTGSDVTTMFSVRIEKTEIPSLSDLQGEVARPPEKKLEVAK